jgi:hypothetical protein
MRYLAGGGNSSNSISKFTILVCKAFYVAGCKGFGRNCTMSRFEQKTNLIVARIWGNKDFTAKLYFSKRETNLIVARAIAYLGKPNKLQ